MAKRVEKASGERVQPGVLVLPTESDVVTAPGDCPPGTGASPKKAKRTTRPLRIRVTSLEVWTTPEVQALLQEGNEVAYEPEERYHMILGPESFFMDKALAKYVKLAVQHCRARVYKKKGVTHGVEDTDEVVTKGSVNEGSGVSETGDHGDNRAEGVAETGGPQDC